MQEYGTLIDATQAARDFTVDRPEGCPPAIFDRLRNQTQGVPEWHETLRVIYDADWGVGDDDTVGPELMKIAAGAFGVFATWRFFDIGQNGDSAKMRMALLRDAGVEAPLGMVWPDPADDPAKSVVVAPPVPPEEPAPFTP
jgi:hypothetical protein